MAITAAICNSYKVDLLNGTQLAADVYKMALYNSSATLDATTTAYSATNEASGTGYTAGGATLAGFSATAAGSTGVLTWTSPSWASSSISASGALIYNSTRSNKAVCVLSFGGVITSTNGAFSVTLPSATVTLN